MRLLTIVTLIFAAGTAFAGEPGLSASLERNPPATARPQLKQLPALSAQERAALEKAMDDLAPCLTGRLLFDRASGIYVPEYRPNCGPADAQPRSPGTQEYAHGRAECRIPRVK